MFVRFVVPERHEESRCLLGVFQAGFRLRDQGFLNSMEALRFNSVRDWFNENLEAPDRFTMTKGRQAHRQAVCWFKGDAVKHINKMYELTRILERHGVSTRRLRSARPGYIVYQDAYQVAVVPFRDTVA